MRKLVFIIAVLIIVSASFILTADAAGSDASDKVYIKIMQKGKMGLMNAEGIIKLKPQYDDIAYYTNNGMIAVKKNGKWGFVDRSLKEVIKPTFDDVSAFYDEWCPVRVGTKWGCIDTKGALIIEPVYDMVYIEPKTKVAIVKQKGKFGAIDFIGKIVIPIKYESIRFLGKEMLSFGLGGKAGMMDDTGKIIVAPQYSDIWRLNGINEDSIDLFKVEYNKKTPIENGYAVQSMGKGLMDKTGKVLIPPEYYDFSYFPEGMIVVTDKKSHYGLADKEGKFSVKPIYKALNYYKAGLYIASKDGENYGLINEKGEDIIKPVYKHMIQFEENLLVNSGGKWYFGRPGPSIEGGKWGIIDKTGRVILSPIYDSISRYGRFGGYVGVRKGGLWGVVDSKGKELIKPQFTGTPENCENGLFLIINYNEKGSLSSAGFIDVNGKTITKEMFPFQNAYAFSEGLAAVQMKGKWGFIDNSGKLVIPCMYDYVNGNFTNGIACVSSYSKDGYRKYSLINKKGKKLVDLNNNGDIYSSIVQIYDYQ